METKAFVLLCFPRSRGGYGLELATLNHRADPGRYEYLAEQGYFRIDICWPGPCVGAEYFGDEGHRDKVVHDRRRLDALEALGWKMVVIDKQRIYDPESFEVAARQIAGYLNARIRKGGNWEAAHAALREDLDLLPDARQLAPGGTARDASGGDGSLDTASQVGMPLAKQN